MNTEEQKANVETNLKAQKETAEKNFKQNARQTPLRTASLIQRGDNYNILYEAEKIYQWLIKDL